MNVNPRITLSSCCVRCFRKPLWTVGFGAFALALLGTDACGTADAEGTGITPDELLDGGRTDTRTDSGPSPGGSAGSAGSAGMAGKGDTPDAPVLLPLDAAEEDAANTTGGQCNNVPDSSVAGACERAACCDLLGACNQEPTCRPCLESEALVCEGSPHWVRLQACRELNECMPQLTVSIVHASANLGPFRLCLRLEGGGKWLDSPPLPNDPSAVMPHTNTVGVAPGGGLVLRHLERFVGTSPAKVIPYLVDVEALASSTNLTKRCEDLLDHCDTLGPCLDSDKYHQLPPVDLGVGTYGISVAVLVVHGCEAPSKGSNDPTSCGLEGGAVENLSLTALPTFKLTPIPPVEGQVRLASANLSPSVAPVYLADAGSDAGLALTYGSLDDGGTTLLQSAGFSSTAEISPIEVGVPSTSTSDLSKFASTGFTLLASGSLHTTPVLQLSLAAVQDLSDNKSLPHLFWNASTDYLIAVVGDAKDSTPLIVNGGINPLFNGYGLHLLALPLRVRPPSLDAGTDSPDAL